MCTGSHAYIPAEDTAELRLHYETPGGIAENVLNFRKSGGFSLTDLADLASAARDSWETNVSPDATEDISLAEVIATDISSETGGQATIVAGISGGFASPALPQNVTLAIKFSTANRGRSYRGRMYYVGLCESNVTGDQVSEAFQTGIIENWEAFFEDVTAAVAGAEHVIVSRCSGGVWRTDAVVTPVTAYSTDRIVDTQKRRLLGHGA